MNLPVRAQVAFNNFMLNTFDVTQVVTGEDSGTFGDTTNTIQQAGNSAIYLGMMLGGFGLAIGIMIVGGMFLLGGSQTKAAAKGWLGWVIIGGVLIFGVIGIVGLIQGLAQGIFS